MNSMTYNFGFIPGSGTEITTALLKDVTAYCNTRGSVVHTCSLDAKGAFDVIRFHSRVRSTSFLPQLFHIRWTDGQTDIARNIRKVTSYEIKYQKLTKLNKTVNTNNYKLRQFVINEKKHCFFTVFIKLQNNDIITFLKILQDYMKHLLRYLFTKIINKTSIFITFSSVLIDNFMFI